MDTEIIRNDDGSLVVPVEPDRHVVDELIDAGEATDEARAADAAATSWSSDSATACTTAIASSRLLAVDTAASRSGFCWRSHSARASS